MGLEAAVDPLSLLLPADEKIVAAIDRNNWVCAIEDGAGRVGTGLLVGEDLVLTNYHVVQALYLKPALAAKARCRFNFCQDSVNDEIAEGRAVGLAGNWSQDLPKSPFSDKDRSGADAGFETDRLDYAVIRIAEKIGQQGVDDPADPDAPQRGWMTLPDGLLPPRPGTPIWVLQHPLGRDGRSALPLKRSDGKVLAVLDGGLRLRHDATTSGGSSGGACFDDELDLVALHQSGDKEERWNQAIPIVAVVGHMRKTGFGHLVGVVPPPRRRRARRQPRADRERAVAAMDVERRIRASRMLMDRDDPENLIQFCRGDANGGIVHIIACRRVDSYLNFLDRLSHLSLDDLGADARRRREAALLGVTAEIGEQPWAIASLRWPGSRYPAAMALAMILKDLDEHMRARRIMLHAEVLIDDCDPTRDVALLAALGKHLAERKVNPRRMQILVIFTDAASNGEPDRHRARRRELGQIWLEARPTGCGASLELEDVHGLDLAGWCEALQVALGLRDNEVRKGVELALPGSRRVSMLAAEEALTPVIRPLLEQARR